MDSEEGRSKQQRARPKGFPEWLRILLPLFLLSVFAAILLAWSIRMNWREHGNFVLANTVMHMRYQIATAHLWFEQAIGGDGAIDMREVWDGFEEGLRLADAMLRGGETKHGLFLYPLEDAVLRSKTEDVKGLMIQLRTSALERFEDPSRGGIGSPMDNRFDAVFEEFNWKGDEIEVLVEKDHITSQQKTQGHFIGLFLLWTAVVGTGSFLICSREKRRLAAEEALKAAVDQVRAKSEELEKHKVHLQEMVDERTEELTVANRQLTREIVEHTKTVEALRQSNSKYERLSIEFHGLLQAIPDSLTLLSPDLEVLWANSGAVSASGTANVPSSSGYCYQMGEERSVPCPDCPALRAFGSGKTEHAQVSRSDGSIWDIRAFPIRNECGGVRNVIEVATDVTEKVALQTESLRMAHLASMGELAAGVAHEINNPINGIINFAEYLVDGGGLEGEPVELLSQIIKQGDRIAAIVRSLLSFAHRGKSEKKDARIHEILSDTLSLSSKQMGREGIILRANVPAELPAIVASPGQIEQVFLNIINNARYALNAKYPDSDGSKILNIYGELVTLRGRDYVRLTFHDTGTGIPSAIMDKLIAPFFSTKPKGSGTGLGLSISHGIVSDHGGSLSFESVEGEYTKVHVILPTRRDDEG